MSLSAPAVSRQMRKRLQAIYDRVPQVACKGLCANECGIIPLQEAELASILQVVGDVPEPSGASCPLLKDGRCSAYARRPLVCRMWGTGEGALRCAWGCKPDRVLSPFEAAELAHEIRALSPVLRCLHPEFDHLVRQHAAEGFRFEGDAIVLRVPAETTP